MRSLVGSWRAGNLRTQDCIAERTWCTVERTRSEAALRATASHHVSEGESMLAIECGGIPSPGGG
jgi:hypothetical protein